ncbi:MAG TPA: hypothetical protein VG498_06760 [Terriglobales bacterium]|nr:hypothetical protein [Terriglobales bacterium]
MSIKDQRAVLMPIPKKPPARVSADISSRTDIPTGKLSSISHPAKILEFTKREARQQ